MTTMVAPAPRATLQQALVQALLSRRIVPRAELVRLYTELCGALKGTCAGLTQCRRTSMTISRRSSRASRRSASMCGRATTLCLQRRSSC